MAIGAERIHSTPNSTAKNIVGKQFVQESLELDLSKATAGQNRIGKMSLVLLMIGLCAIAGILLGTLSAPLILASVAPLEIFDRPLAILILLVVAVWLVSISLKGTAISIPVTSFAVLIAVIAVNVVITDQPCRELDVNPESPYCNPPLLLNKILEPTVVILLCLALSNISWFSIRAVDAIFAIVLNRFHAIKVFSITTVSIILSVLVGRSFWLSYRVNVNALSDISPVLVNRLNSSTTIVLVIVGGILITSIWIASALWVNRRQGVPWHHPDALRSFALAVGSWQGTSFRELDLSRLNFSHAYLANTDLRAKQLYRTCFKGVQGLALARVNSHYLDLELPKVQQLLTQGTSSESDFTALNLQGAYLQDADMRGFNLTDSNLTDADLQRADMREAVLIRTELAHATLQQADLRQADLTDANLTGADLRDADLRQVKFIRAQVARADFTGADLTGACIEDWSISAQTRFNQVRCAYIYRKFQDGQGGDRYPITRDFEPGEFAALFQKSEGEVELVFKGEFNYNALSLAFYKLQTEEPELQLKLNGIEQRGDLWIVKIVSTNPEVEALLEKRLSETYEETTQESKLEAAIKDSIYKEYEEIKKRLSESEQLVKQLAGVSENQAEALKELSKKPFGNNFFITGSTITNLTGSGNIVYTEAAQQVRTVVSQSRNANQFISELKILLRQFQESQVATTATAQVELLQQVLLKEAQADPIFKAFLLQEGKQILSTLPKGAIATTIRAVLIELSKAS